MGAGDLPSEIVVLDDSACPAGTDEGRAMMQLVHDVAPGSRQAFHTASGGIANFARGIEELAGCPPGSQPGCVADPSVQADVIVDDILYFAEPMFQDGVVAQAVDKVVDNGVAYFSSAGNNGRKSYESAFVNSGQFPLDGGIPAHDFDPGGGVDPFQSVTIPAGCPFTITLQWDDPFFSVSGAPGATTDMDLAVFNNPPTALLAISDDFNTGADPVEILQGSAGGSPFTFNVVLLRFAGPDPTLMKYVISSCSGTTINQFNTSSSTIYGHANAASARAVGAAFYGNTPAFGTSPPVAQTFSSSGPTSIFFNTSGASISPIVRNKPEIVAPDGGNTTFFGSDVEPDGFPNFFGTSAAAPHAAAVAALMLDANSSLTPAQIYSALESTSVDMGATGFDNDTGFGLINAEAAVSQIASLSPCTPPPTGNWTITAGQSCILSQNDTVLGNVIVEAGASLTIASGVTLTIDFSANHLLIKDGAKVVVQDGGKIE